MKNSIPPLFLERLERIVPHSCYRQVVDSFARKKADCVRLNKFVAQAQEVEEEFSKHGISFEKVGFESAYVLGPLIEGQKAAYRRLIDNGALYPQNLSSMLPVYVLDPRPGETVLDVCAAPGSKTSQIASRMNGIGRIVAVEAIPKRMYKLRSVLKLLNVPNTDVICCDARRFDAKGALFDRILVDAPCSSEARFSLSNPKTFAFWSLRKVKEMQKKQKGILLSASRLLKLGGRMVYSTCSFSPEEDEMVVEWFLRKDSNFVLEEIFLPESVSTYHVNSISSRTWEVRDKVKRVLPTAFHEGFFIASLVKTANAEKDR